MESLLDDEIRECLEGVIPVALATCAADGTGTATVTPTAGAWTIGSGTGDITTHALMVHVGNNANPGGRMACGLINAQ